MNTILGQDLGMGANKLVGPAGGIQILSHVSVANGTITTPMLGLGRQKAPTKIAFSGGSFYTGAGAHDWGRPVENMDYDRLSGSPEILALFYAGLSEYAGLSSDKPVSLDITVGLPLEILTADSTAPAAIRRWMIGQHTWFADGQAHQVTVTDAKITSQPVGALFDYLLDDDGHFVPSRKAHFKAEIGIISIGFNTVELLVVRDKAPVQRFTAGTTSGVRRLLELVNTQRLYSLGEMDLLLRQGKLDLNQALPVWQREVGSAIESRWGNLWRRFPAVIVVGGGAIILRDAMLARFNGKSIFPDDPVLSIARGLYKLGLMQAGKAK